MYTHTNTHCAQKHLDSELQPADTSSPGFSRVPSTFSRASSSAFEDFKKEGGTVCLKDGNEQDQQDQSPSTAEQRMDKGIDEGFQGMDEGVQGMDEDTLQEEGAKAQSVVPSLDFGSLLIWQQTPANLSVATNLRCGAGVATNLRCGAGFGPSTQMKSEADAKEGNKVGASSRFRSRSRSRSRSRLQAECRLPAPSPRVPPDVQLGRGGEGKRGGEGIISSLQTYGDETGEGEDALHDAARASTSERVSEVLDDTGVAARTHDPPSGGQSGCTRVLQRRGYQGNCVTRDGEGGTVAEVPSLFHGDVKCQTDAPGGINARAHVDARTHGINTRAHAFARLKARYGDVSKERFLSDEDPDNPPGDDRCRNRHMTGLTPAQQGPCKDGQTTKAVDIIPVDLHQLGLGQHQGPEVQVVTEGAGNDGMRPQAGQETESELLARIQMLELENARLISLYQQHRTGDHAQGLQDAGDKTSPSPHQTAEARVETKPRARVTAAAGTRTESERKHAPPKKASIFLRTPMTSDVIDSSFILISNRVSLKPSSVCNSPEYAPRRSPR